MAAPTVGHARALRRLARYLVAYPRIVWHFPWQEEVGNVHAFSDSDWAGCRVSAKSTSGGVLMRGRHCLRLYSVTQKNITLSSAEAELVALVRCTSEAIGMSQLAQGWGISLEAEILLIRPPHCPSPHVVAWVSSDTSGLATCGSRSVRRRGRCNTRRSGERRTYAPSFCPQEVLSPCFGALDKSRLRAVQRRDSHLTVFFIPSVLR